MKNKLAFMAFAMVIVAGGLLAGCTTFLVEPLPFGGSESQIVGAWELKPSGGQYPQIFYFEEDGSWTRQNIGEVPQTGYYSFDGTNLKLLNKYFSVTTTANLNGDTFTITYPNNSHWVYSKKAESN
jgi:hypothetical protein